MCDIFAYNLYYPCVESDWYFINIYYKILYFSKPKLHYVWNFYAFNDVQETKTKTGVTRILKTDGNVALKNTCSSGCCPWATTVLFICQRFARGIVDSASKLITDDTKLHSN